jgi:hypothetical protein
MPEMSYTPQTVNDASALTMGWHPGFLVKIGDEPTPESWQMFAASPRMWRWHFLVWADASRIPHEAPEQQSAPSSQKFTPKGRQQASKAYSWASALLGHQIQPGERVNLDTLMPLPCRVKVERKEQWANIVDVEAWPEGQAYLTPDLRTNIQALFDGSGDGTPPSAPRPVSPPPPAPTAPPTTASPPTPVPQAGRPAWAQAAAPATSTTQGWLKR